MNATTATQRQTADERRDAVIVAAVREFAAGGYAGTSIESIARAVGVSQPYLFQLFGTKRAIFLAAVRHAFQRTRLVFHEAAKRRPEDDQACSVLELMGTAYMRLLSDRDLLRVQLQAYAACGDDDVRQVVREEFAALYASVKRDSGAPDVEIHHFFAEGMLLNVAAALELGGTPETWSLAVKVPFDL
jgi:AcrR family transcriptional regulator